MGDEYNITAYWREVNRDLRGAYRHSDLRAGSLAPPFTLTGLDGRPVTSTSLLASGDVVVVFGCHSAPPCQRELPEIDRLCRSFPPDVRTLLVYTREIHPNEDLPYGRFPHHTSMKGKLDAATRLRDELGLEMTVAVDDLDGTAHMAYGGLPFCAVVVRRDGVLVHRSEWASARLLAHVVENLIQAGDRRAGGGRPRMGFSETLWASENLESKL